MKIGVSLILQATGEELQSWPNLPPTITYKGETRTGAIVGAEIGGDALLVDRVLSAGPPAGDCPVVSESVAFDGSKVVVTRGYGDPVPPTITVDQVVVERERRLGLGFTYDFGNDRGQHIIGTSAADMVGWSEVTTATQAAIALGQSGLSLTIKTNTGEVQITAMEWQQILLAATAFRQPIWLASFALQAMSPIPSDYTADVWWP